VARGGNRLLHGAGGERDHPDHCGALRGGHRPGAPVLWRRVVRRGVRHLHRNEGEGSFLPFFSSSSSFF
jgi:hypothetical protein